MIRYTFSDGAALETALLTNPQLAVSVSEASTLDVAAQASQEDFAASETTPWNLARACVHSAVARHVRHVVWVTNTPEGLADDAIVVAPRDVLDEDALGELESPLCGSTNGVIVDCDALDEFGDAWSRLAIMRHAQYARVCVRICPDG
jgi:hypothetical protein